MGFPIPVQYIESGHTHQFGLALLSSAGSLTVLKSAVLWFRQKLHLYVFSVPADESQRLPDFAIAS